MFLLLMKYNKYAPQSIIFSALSLRNLKAYLRRCETSTMDLFQKVDVKYGAKQGAKSTAGRIEFDLCLLFSQDNKVKYESNPGINS